MLHGNETRLYNDSAYRGQQDALKITAPRAKDFTNKRACRNTPLTERDKEVNRTKSQTRVKVEHPLLTLKRFWGFAKVRYRGLAKNANRTFAMLALINIDKWGKPLGLSQDRRAQSAGRAAKVAQKEAQNSRRNRQNS